MRVKRLVYNNHRKNGESPMLQLRLTARPRRNPDTLAEHGFAGGARMTMIGNEEDDDEDDLDAEGEPVPDGDESDADSLLDSRPAKRRDRRRSEDSLEAPRGSQGKQRAGEKEPRSAKKAVALDDDDDDDD
jgi:hypothetical protein